MLDYPKNQLDFEVRFSTEDACREYLYNLRFGQGWVCEHCAGTEHWRQSRGRITCASCRSEISLTSGTVFHGSHLSLMVWFRALWWITNQKQGINALGIQRALGLGSYRSAWLMLQKLRSSMVRAGRDRLKGEVEVDETFVGGRIASKSPRINKHIVMIAAEKIGKKTGRIRMKLIHEAGSYDLIQGVKEMVEPGSIVETDGWHGYRDLPKQGYQHRRIVAKTIAENELLPGLHRVASLFKRWLKGTLQGRYDQKHLQRYLDEFVFRFNRRTSHSRGLLFHRLLENSVEKRALQYDEIVADTPKPPYMV